MALLLPAKKVIIAEINRKNNLDLTIDDLEFINQAGSLRVKGIHDYYNKAPLNYSRLDLSLLFKNIPPLIVWDESISNKTTKDLFEEFSNRFGGIFDIAEFSQEGLSESIVFTDGSKRSFTFTPLPDSISWQGILTIDLYWLVKPKTELETEDALGLFFEDGVGIQL